MFRLLFFVLVILPGFVRAAVPVCQLVDPRLVDIPEFEKFRGRSGFIYDTSASALAIGPNNPYVGQTYGAVAVQEAIQRYLPTKDFQDGILDIFVGVRVGDPDPAMELSRIYEVATFFGAQGRAVRGMARNPEAKRGLRVFILEADARPLGGPVPPAFLELGSELAKEFGVDVAVTSHYVTVVAPGLVVPSGTPGWATFAPE